MPFTGNPFLGFPATLTTIGGWATRDGGAAPTVEGGGHDWFGGGSSWDAGAPVRASETLLAFFVRHPMP